MPILKFFADSSHLLQEIVATVSRLDDDGSFHILTNSWSISDPPHWGCIFSLLTAVRSNPQSDVSAPAEGATGMFRFITTEICASNDIFISVQRAAICAVHVSRTSAEHRPSRELSDRTKEGWKLENERNVHNETWDPPFNLSNEMKLCIYSWNWILPKFTELIHRESLNNDQSTNVVRRIMEATLARCIKLRSWTRATADIYTEALKLYSA